MTPTRRFSFPSIGRTVRYIALHVSSRESQAPRRPRIIGGMDLHPTDELRLRAMLDHPHQADAIADLDDDEVEDAAGVGDDDDETDSDIDDE